MKMKIFYKIYIIGLGEIKKKQTTKKKNSEKIAKYQKLMIIIIF